MSIFGIHALFQSADKVDQKDLFQVELDTAYTRHKVTKTYNQIPSDLQKNLREVHTITVTQITDLMGCRNTVPISENYVYFRVLVDERSVARHKL